MVKLLRRIRYRLARWEVQIGYGDAEHVRFRSKASAMAYSEGVQDAVERGIDEHLVWLRGPGGGRARKGPYLYRRYWYYGGKP